MNTRVDTLQGSLNDVQFDEWTMSLRKNPKIVSQPGSNTEKPPEEWVSGSEPMTGAQASYLKTLSEQASEPEAFDATLTKAEASRRIDALKAKLAKELSSGVERPGVSFDPELQRDD